MIYLFKRNKKAKVIQEPGTQLHQSLVPVRRKISLHSAIYHIFSKLIGFELTQRLTDEVSSRISSPAIPGERFSGNTHMVPKPPDKDHSCHVLLRFPGRILIKESEPLQVTFSIIIGYLPRRIHLPAPSTCNTRTLSKQVHIESKILPTHLQFVVFDLRSLNINCIQLITLITTSLSDAHQLCTSGQDCSYLDPYWWHHPPQFPQTLWTGTLPAAELD